MLVAFSFFCCCLILLWFCTLPALLVFVVLLAVLFCLILLLLVLPFSEIFGFVLFCFVFLILTLFHNLIFTNCFLYFWFCFVLLSFVIIIFLILLLFYNLTCFLGMSGSKKTYKPPVAVFFFLTWFYMARFGCFVLIREFGSKSLVLNQFLTNNSFYIHVHNVSEEYPIHTKSN